MRLRVFWGHFLNRLGRFIQSLPVMIMKPVDLIAFSRRIYSSPATVESFGREETIRSGLRLEEESLLKKIPSKKGRLLLLGVGGGREAISLAQAGFEVTGIDFVPAMVAKAEENAARYGVKFNGLVQEISRLDVPAASYEIVWLAEFMYSCVPTKKRRVKMLQRIRNALKPGGYLVCQFAWGTAEQFSQKVELVRKAVAFLTLGNLGYEKGDILAGHVEFMHSFSSELELETEFEEGGFKVSVMEIRKERRRGGAVLKIA